MPISDWIAQHGLDAAWQYLLTTPGFALLLRGMPTKHHIQPGLARLGITTVEQLNATVAAIQHNVPSHRVLADMISPRPPFELHRSTKLPFNPTIHALINQQYDTTPVVPERFWHDDSVNSLLPYAELKWLADHNPGIQYQWNSGDERRDCDNSVRLFLGWLASMGLDDTAIGHARTLHYQGAKLLYVHAVALGVDDQQRVWQIDTMYGGLHPPTECNLGNASSQRADRLALYKIDF